MLPCCRQMLKASLQTIYQYIDNTGIIERFFHSNDLYQMGLYITRTITTNDQSLNTRLDTVEQQIRLLASDHITGILQSITKTDEQMVLMVQKMDQISMTLETIGTQLKKSPNLNMLQDTVYTLVRDSSRMSDILNACTKTTVKIRDDLWQINRSHKVDIS
jgi:hypothetical protein